MPVKNVIKDYKPDSFYHIYNLGVDSRVIFDDKEDYQTMLSYIEQGLTPPPQKHDLRQTITIGDTSFKGAPRQPKNFFGQLELHAFCLMPTHFHFLVRQKQVNGIETFMRSLGTRYVMYFNKKHGRKGPLFQGTYKAIDVVEEPMLLHLSRFIHQKPQAVDLPLVSPNSSYGAYIQYPKNWITTKPILEMLDRDQFLKSLNPTYQHFIESFDENSKKVLGPLTLED